MKAFLVPVALLAACGDNSRVCGSGTMDVDGFCTAGNPPQVCGDGTVLDELTGDCVIDPSVCGEGTVLIDGVCKDPAEGLVVDLLEALEPNGFEPDATPAGIINLKTVGEGYVIHGCVKPVDGDTPDLDRYILTVGGPTLIHFAADGVHGLAAGFLVRNDGSDPTLAGWQRLGISLATDTSKREVLIPKAGTYDVIFTDSRTLFPITQGSTTAPAAGDLEGNSCYFATLTVRSLVPAPLDIAGGDTGTIGEELRPYTATFADGFTQMSAMIDPVGDRAAAALVVLNNTELAKIADGTAANPKATALFGGAPAGGETIVVLDYVWSMAIQPIPYTVSVDASIASKPLPLGGGTVNDTSHGRSFGGQLANINLFHFDVPAAGATMGIELTSTIQLQGSLVDDGANVAAKLTGFAGSATSSTTFADYRGLARFRKGGRHYLMVFAPRNPIGTAIQITSRIAAQTVEDVIMDVPTTPVPVNQFDSNAFTYDGSIERWQLWNVTGTNTGNLTVSWFDAATTFGRLDTMAIRSGGGAGAASMLAPDCGAACDLGPRDLQHRLTFAANGSTPAGRLLKDPTTLAPVVTDFFVKVNPAIATGNRNIALDFTSRIYLDLFTVDAGETTTQTGQVIDAGNRERRYYLETVPGNRITITATPTGTPATLDVEIALIDTREADTRVVDASPLPAAETLNTTAGASGFLAFEVRGGTALSSGDYTIDVKVDPP